jgi:hypothetical protein
VKKLRLHTSTKTAMLFSTEIFQLLVEQTNLYYQQHWDRQAGPSHQLPDVTLPDMMTFTALALQMRHYLKDMVRDYWSRLRQLHTPFYSETMTRHKVLLHILRFLHSAHRPDHGKEYNRLWKLRTIFDTLNQLSLNSVTPRDIWQWTR